ncbi:MAG: tetratricopeptide repeat protein [Acidimicrobiia bacterium]
MIDPGRDSTEMPIEEPTTRSKLDRFGPVAAFVALGVIAVMLIAGIFLSVTFGGDEFSDLEAEGLHLYTDGEWSEAAAVLTTLIDSYPVTDHEALALAHYRRSLVYFEQGLIEDALADESAAIGHNPSDTTLLALLYLNRSREYSYLGMTDESIADATAAIDLKTSDTTTLARAYVNRAQGLSAVDRGEEAVADFTAAIEISPVRSDRDSVLVFRAEELARIGRFNDAIDDATAAIDALSSYGAETRDGTRATTSELLGRAYLTRGNARFFLSGETDTLDDVADQVETDLSHAIDLLPENEPERLARAHFSRGSLHYFTWNDEAARHDLEHVQELVPERHHLYQSSAELLADIIT